MSPSRTLVVAVSGIALGTLIGMLVAPASGRETRKKIRRATTDVKDTLAYRYLQAEDLLVKLRAQVGTDPATRMSPTTPQAPTA